MYEPFEIVISVGAIIFGIIVIADIIFIMVKQYHASHPTKKTIERIENIRMAKNEWRLRYGLSEESDRYYIANYSEYKKALIEWKRYHTMRMYYAQKIIEMVDIDKDKVKYKERDKVLEQYNHCLYCKENRIKSDDELPRCNDNFIRLMVEMEERNVNFVYRPGIDYMPINGPEWADSPETVNVDSGNKFVIRLEDMGDVVMDRKKYYKEDALREFVRIKYKK